MKRGEFERRKYGWTIGMLAFKTGLSPSVVSNAEQGEGTEETYYKLSRALKVYPPEVLRREVQPKREPEEVAYSFGPEEAGQA